MGKESWAKYGMEKGKGTAMKSGAFMEAKEEGFAAAMSAPPGSAGNQILKNAVAVSYTQLTLPTICSV